MSHFIAIITGFREGELQPTGGEKLLRKLLALDLDAFIGIYTWKYDFKSLAKFVARMGFTRITIIAYSWGCGDGAKKLTKHLKKLNRDVDEAFYQDPVYRFGLPTWLPINPLTLLAPTIKIAWNVKKIGVWYQRWNIPRGSYIKTTNPQTQVLIKREVHGVPHVEMDEYEPAHDFICDYLVDT